MDHFHEEVAIKRNHTFDDLVYYFSWVVIFICGLYALLQFASITAALRSGTLVWTLVTGAVAAAFAAAIYFYHDRLRVEYEYTFTNGSLDFAQVFNNKKRKSLGSLNVRTVDAFGPVNGQAFKRYISMQNTKQMRWFQNRDGNLHYFCFQKDSVRKIIIMEPSDELVGLIRKYLPHGAWQE
ncbi:MAG: hypothetical protein IKS31_08615 [Clostridia bacterium]|nr:hypothetical protein [Clostridia bacterium]MBR4459007.1 hypothetical protein [Clostridia bacterium]